MTITPHQVENATTWRERPGGFSPETIADVLNAAIRAGLVFDSAPLDGDRQYQVVTKATAQRLKDSAGLGGTGASWTDIINAVLDNRERLQAGAEEILYRGKLNDDHIYYCKDGKLIPVNTQPGFWSTNYLSDDDEGESMTLGRYRQSTWQEQADVASDAGPITPVETPPADQGVTFIGGALLDGGRTKDGWGWSGKEWVRGDSAPVDHSNDPEIVEQHDAEERNVLGERLDSLELRVRHLVGRADDSLQRIRRLESPTPGQGGFVGSGGAWGGPTITDQYGRIWPVVGGSVGYPNGGGGGGSNHWQGWTAGGPTPGDTTGDEHPGVS